jgi:hypothetical protein
MANRDGVHPTTGRCCRLLDHSLILLNLPAESQQLDSGFLNADQQISCCQ